ncbi:hypothetical protein D3C73_743110 [compost metagenome]
MAFQCPLQFLAHGLRFGDVDRHAGRTIGRHHIDHIQHGAITMNDGREPIMERRCDGGLGPDHLAADGAEQFSAFFDRACGGCCVDSLAIGMVDPGKFALAITAPDRLFDCIEQRFEHRD